MKNTCIQCNKEFEAERITGKYCSDICKLAYHRKQVSVSNSVSEVSVSKCSHCGQEVPKDVYTCVSCCEKIRKGEIEGGQKDKVWNDYKIVGEYKNNKGDVNKLVFCGIHQEHAKEYCEKYCNGNCVHILKE
jgi:hypothetical protein